MKIALIVSTLTISVLWLVFGISSIYLKPDILVFGLSSNQLKPAFETLLLIHYSFLFILSGLLFLSFTTQKNEHIVTLTELEFEQKMTWEVEMKKQQSSQSKVSDNDLFFNRTFALIDKIRKKDDTVDADLTKEITEIEKIVVLLTNIENKLKKAENQLN